MIATGLHRNTTKDELIDKFGADIVQNEKIVIHDCDDKENLVDLGVLPSGGKLVVNRIAVESDLLVSEGFIEPHFFTGQLKVFGKALNLMHIPIFICGFTCGGLYGCIVGITAPLLRSVLFGMPVLLPSATAMAFELGAYGLCSGIFFKIFYNNRFSVIISLVLSMIIGRIVWGAASLVVYSFMGKVFTFAYFIKGAFVDSVIGIVIQLILLPVIIGALKRAHLVYVKDE